MSKLSPALPIRSLEGSDIEDDGSAYAVASDGLLDSPEGELALLAALIQFRPVGLSRHWAMLGILRVVQQRLRSIVTAEMVWQKLESLYDLSLLEEDSDMAGPPVGGGSSAAAAAPPPVSAAGPPSPQPADGATRKRKRRSSMYNANAAGGSLSASIGAVDEAKPDASPSAADRALSPYPPSKSVTTVYSNLEFSLLDRPEFDAELDRRRMANTPSPAFARSAVEDDEDGGSELSSPAKDENDDTQMMADDDTLTPRKIEDAEAGAAARPTRTHGRRASQRSPTRPAPSAGPSVKRSSRKARASAAQDEDGDAISETASTLSALSDNGEDEARKVADDETAPEKKQRGRRASRKKEETPPAEPEEVEESAEGEVEAEEDDEGDEEDGDEAVDEDGDDDEEEEEEEEEEEDSPDEVGPNDQPFKSPGKKEAKRRKMNASAAAGANASSDAQSDDAGKRVGQKQSARGRAAATQRGRGARGRAATARGRR